MFKRGDFHLHSNYSDGKYGIKELLDLYKKENYDIIALTDHDTLEGCMEAIEYGKQIGLKVVTGIEISTKHNGEDVHILGYFKDEDCNRKEMIEFSKNKEQDRINRCKAIVSRLKEYFNIEIDGDELLSKVKGMIGRLHIAKEIINAGYETSVQAVFNKYLGNDSPAYIPSSILSVQEGIDLLKNNNAVAVMAHPILIKKTKIEDLLNDYEFDGIEAIYGLNSQEDTDKYIKLSKEKNLLITGGSDFHDFDTAGHSNIGDIALDSENIEKLLKLIQSK
ncbi:PHP domain-containing protein [Clostridium sp. C2-6-12]|uniref:PHP domain-containing protein n=1 Tax=Clostridium sp. C2-6-12 TaxID=2698832 RepID=UPI00136A5C0B|nr:PHP domain-containing protein [Clostridium sp. C2-6-12]